MKKLKIVSRTSKLAIVQAEIVASAINRAFPDVYAIEILTLKTTGDKILDISLNKIGGKGLFTKEIEEALLEKKADIAVHSMKDMPAQTHPELMIAGTLEREDERDAIISKENYKSIAELPRNAIVGTSSVRRSSQILYLRPDIQIKDLRGNVLTRINKLENNEYQAIILAVSGLKRLNLDSSRYHAIAKHEILPASAQGALALQVHADNTEAIQVLKAINHEPTLVQVMCERAFLGEFNATCSTPIAASCEIINNELHLNALIAKTDGSIIHRTHGLSNYDDGKKLGKEVATKLKNLVDDEFFDV